MGDRLDVLVALAIDEALDPAQADELDALLQDPHEHTRALELMRIEAGLRGDRELTTAVVEAVIDRCRTRTTSRLVRAVMRDIRPRRRRPAATTWGRPLLIAAGLLLLVGGLAIGLRQRTQPADVMVVALRGVAHATTSGRTLRLAIGDSVGPGAGLRIPAGATVTLRVGDGTEALLTGPANATIGRSGPRFVLHDGSIAIAAAHHHQPLALVATAHAECAVIGTRFTVSVADGVTALTVVEGRVSIRTQADRVERLVAEGQTCQVDAGGFIGLPHITGFALAAALDGAVIRPLDDRAVLSAQGFRERALTVVALTGPESVGGVRMQLIGPAGQASSPAHWENIPPFTLLGDVPPINRTGPARCKHWAPLPGTYRIEALPASGADGAGKQGPLVTITVTITADAP